MADPYREGPTSKAQLFDWIRTEHDLLEGVLARLNAEQMVEPSLEGGWSCKDVLAHITAWEQLMLTRLRVRHAERDIPELAFGFGTDNDERVDELNERIYVESKDRPIQEIRLEFNRTYDELLQEVEAVPEDDLFTTDRFGWFKGRALWQMVGANTLWHYLEHREAIEGWLDKG